MHDAGVYVTSREAFEHVGAASKWGLTVSIHKTQRMVAGSHIAPTDTLPLQLEGGLIEIIQDFAYLGSCTSRDGDIKKEVTCCIEKTARAVGCLQEPIFQNHRLSVETKRKVYREVVLSVLLYGTETWTTKVESVKCLCGFHNRCFRTLIGVYNYQQWKERISSNRLASAFGMEDTMVQLLLKQRLQWIGHVARMKSFRMPKQLLFGELVKKRLSHGTKRRWHDVAVADVKAVDVSDG